MVGYQGYSDRYGEFINDYVRVVGGSVEEADRSSVSSDRGNFYNITVGPQ